MSWKKRIRWDVIFKNHCYLMVTGPVAKEESHEKSRFIWSLRAYRKIISIVVVPVADGSPEAPALFAISLAMWIIKYRKFRKSGEYAAYREFMAQTKNKAGCCHR